MSYFWKILEEWQHRGVGDESVTVCVSVCAWIKFLSKLPELCVHSGGSRCGKDTSREKTSTLPLQDLLLNSSLSFSSKPACLRQNLSAGCNCFATVIWVIPVIWAASGHRPSTDCGRSMDSQGFPSKNFQERKMSNFLYSPHWGSCPSELCGILHYSLCIKINTLKAKTFKYL